MRSTGSDSLRLHHLRFGRIALGFMAASAPSMNVHATDLGETARLLGELQEKTILFSAGQSSLTLQLKDAERQIDEAFAALAGRENGDAFCWEKAVAYIALESPDSQGIFEEDVELHIIGSKGHWYYQFKAGTTIQSAVNEMNSHTPWTYAHATISSANPYRIEVQSSYWSSWHNYLEIKQLSGGTPIVQASATGGKAMFHWIDYGCHIGVPACAEPAVLFLSTGSSLDNYGAGSTTLLVEGFRGLQIFTFASGTSQHNIIEAINTIQFHVGVIAAKCDENTARVELRSAFLGQGGFVSVMQIGGSPPIVVDTSTAGNTTYAGFDFGRDRLDGDANCDRIVNVADLLLVVNQWGECPLPPFECVVDVTGEGAVNVNDLLRVINNWGASDP